MKNHRDVELIGFLWTVFLVFRFGKRIKYPDERNSFQKGTSPRSTGRKRCRSLSILKNQA